MIKALVYKTKYSQIVDSLGELLSGTEYGMKYKEFTEKFEEISHRDKIHIVVAGGWSTGKSTLIKALTDDESIGIDSDVKTDKVYKHEYHGLCIVDTPGLHSGNDEHTQKAESEIKNADRIVYCITAQQMFSPSTKKEFASIVERAGSENKAILAVTKFGLEATGDEDPFDAMDRIQDAIEHDLAEVGVNGTQYEMSVFAAQRYIEGIEQDDIDLVDASYFKEFMELLDESSDGDTKKLSYVKCRRQGEIIDRFISEIMQEIRNNCSDEEEQESLMKRKEIDQRIKASKALTKRSFHKAILELENSIIELCRKEEESENDVKAQIENQLNSCLADLNTLIDEQISQIGADASSSGSIDDEVVLKTETNTEKKVSHLLERLKDKQVFSSAGSGMKKGFETVNALGKPVTKKKIFRKKVISEIGGEGTELYTKLIKLSPKHGAEMSLKLGSLAGKMSKSAEILDKVGVVVDVGVTVAGSAKEQYEEKRRQQRRGKFRGNLSAEIVEIESMIKASIDDRFEEVSERVEQEYIDTDTANGKLVSGLQKQLNVLRKLTDDFNINEGTADE